MTQRFVIEVQDKRGSGSSARGSSQSSANPDAAAKKAADTAIKEAKRAADAQQKAADALVRAQNNVFIASQKAAQKAADAAAKEAKRAADAQVKEAQRAQAEVEKGLNASIRFRDKEARSAETAAKRIADAQLREAKRASEGIAREQQRAAKASEQAANAAAAANRRAQGQALQGTFRGTRAASTGIGVIGSGLGQAAGTLAGGASDAVSGLANGSLLSGDPIRAIAGLATSGLKAGAQLAGAIGKGLGQALPGALSAVGGIIGSVFSGAGGLVGGLLGKIVGNLAGGLSKAIGAALSIAGELGGILTSAVGEIAGFIGDKLGLALKVAIGGAAGVAFLGLRDALKEDKINGFFERFAQKSGVTATQGVEKLTAATQGLISVLDLKAAAQLADQRQAVTSIDQLAELAQFANEFGDSLGKDAAEGLDILTESLGRLQSKGLKGALGESADFNKVIQEVADTAGIAVDAISDDDQHLIALNVTLKALRANFQGLGKEANGPSENFERLQASVNNSLLSIGHDLLPALDRVLKAIEPIAKAVGKFFDNNNKQVADGIANAVGTLTDKLAKVPAIIANIKLDEVFGLIGQAAVGVWDAFATAGRAAIASLGPLLDALFENAKDKAKSVLIGDAGAGSKAADAGLINPEAEAAARRSNRLSNALAQSSATFSAGTGSANSQLGALGASIAAQLAAIAARAGTGALPAATPTQPAAHPLASLGGGGGGSTFTTGGSSSGGIQAATAQLVGAVNTTAGSLFALSGVFATAAEKAGVQRLIDAQKKLIDKTEESFQHQQRVADLGRKIATDITESHKKEGEARDKIVADFQKASDAIRTKLGADLEAIDAAKKSAIEANNKSATDNLVSGVGGLEADDSGIPKKLKRAAAKVRRAANRERKDSLNAASAGLSVDELAANGGAALKGVLAQQGAKDASGANAAATAQAQLAAAQAQLAAQQELLSTEQQKNDQLKTLGEETAKALDETKSEALKAFDLQSAQIDTLKDHAEAMKKLQERLDSLEKQLKSVPSVGGR